MTTIEQFLFKWVATGREETRGGREREPWSQCERLTIFHSMISTGKSLLEERESPKLYLHVNGIRWITFEEQEKVGSVDHWYVASFPKFKYGPLLSLKFQRPIKCFWCFQHWIYSYIFHILLKVYSCYPSLLVLACTYQSMLNEAKKGWEADSPKCLKVHISNLLAKNIGK